LKDYAAANHQQLFKEAGSFMVDGFDPFGPNFFFLTF
jgi:hypothetical protein